MIRVSCEINEYLSRAVGYFTSRGLSVAAQGITALISGNGRMQLVASPLFDSDDLDAIENGYFARDDVITRSLLRQIESTPDSVVANRLGYLAWLIAEERLDVRIAVPQDDNGKQCEGIYHEKIGLFSDICGNTVAFTGSPNETAGGLVHNFESTEVFCSWRDAEGRVTKKIENFRRLWDNETSRLVVRPFPEAAREQLLRYRPKPRIIDADPHHRGTPVAKMVQEIQSEWKAVILACGRPCTFLTEENRCAVYATRPNCCVGLQAGDEQCQAARKAEGIPPLEPAALAKFSGGQDKSLANRSQGQAADTNS